MLTNKISIPIAHIAKMSIPIAHACVHTKSNELKRFSHLVTKIAREKQNMSRNTTVTFKGVHTVKSLISTFKSRVLSNTILDCHHSLTHIRAHT